mmetsp:Transcript_1525/g.2523  ORF Transcript_1525/g.2523 Transcript_1525/m.2523 type:complete len:339 (+) Transcript_1525:131-1147(+)
MNHTLFAILLIFSCVNAVVVAKIVPPSNSNANQATISKLASIRGGGALGDVANIDWRYFAAGGICAGCSHGITTPIDVIKTRMQTDPEAYQDGVWQAAKDIIAAEGIGFLLAGLGPTVLGYGIEGALKFGFYETFKVVFKGLTPYPFVNFLLASVIAGAIASVVLCPMEEARIKMVGDADWAHETTISSIARLVREDGLFDSFSGLNAMLSKQVPYTMGKQVSFDFITKLLYAVSATFALSKEDCKWVISVASAFLASILACVFSQPGDMILTETYKGHGSTHSFRSIVQEIQDHHGPGGFFLGLKARLAHVASIITSQLVIYDLVKMALGLPITGSG